MIRGGRQKDKKKYLRVQKEAFPTIDSRRDSKFFDLKIKNKEIFVLEVDKEYIGHICFGKNLYNPPFAGSVFIEEFTVRKKFRGEGYGTDLMESLVKYCKRKKITDIILGTGDFKGNKAVKYYKKQGFKKIGWLKDLEGEKELEHDHPQLFYGIKVKNWKRLR